MADLMPGIPIVPGDESTWEAFVDQFETLKRGDMPLSLTNWDDTDTRPALAAGAAIEIAGATYRFPSEVAIDNSTGLVAGKVYVVIQTSDPNPESATPYFTNVEPVWYADLHGWYDAAGFSRYTGHVMTWDGVSSYTLKNKIFSEQKVSIVEYDSEDITETASIILPIIQTGLLILSSYHAFKDAAGDSSMAWALEYNTPEGWYEIDGETITSNVNYTIPFYRLINSTGDNFRINLSFDKGTVTSMTFRQKFKFDSFYMMVL